jgi:hypothetical protein
MRYKYGCALFCDFVTVVVAFLIVPVGFVVGGRVAVTIDSDVNLNLLKEHFVNS